MSQPNVPIVNPAQHYESPAALAADHELMRAERIALLKEWQQLALAEERAALEGMPGPRHGDLRAIAEALSTLERSEDELTTAPRVAGVPFPSAPRLEPARDATTRPTLGIRFSAAMALAFAVALVVMIAGGATSPVLYAFVGAGLVLALIAWTTVRLRDHRADR